MNKPLALTRRDLLRWSSLSALGGASLAGRGWLGSLAAHAAEATAKPKSCILLWLDGGPSHIDTFDPKPDAPPEYRGEFKTISTSAPGVQVTDRLEKVAQWMHKAVVLRGMSTTDNNHDTARILMHTGYKKTAGIEHPALGAVVSSERGNSAGVMPNFVVTGVHAYDSVKFPFVTTGGYLGPRHGALVVNHLDRGVENLHTPLAGDEFQDRLAVLEEMEQGFLSHSRAAAAQAHQTMLHRAVELMRSDAAKAFDLTLEPEKSRAPYGEGYFGRGCLLARRLIEVGVPFVEVYLPDFDTHFKARVDRCVNQSLPQLDTGLSALLADLEQRGLLDGTLVICMGEFGRSPKINDKAGRDHYSKAWTSVLFGGGLKTGQVVGRTDAHGGTVEERPISTVDFMATVCLALGIDYKKELIGGGGRPIPIVNTQTETPRPIEEIL